MTQDDDGSAPMLGSVANHPAKPDGWIPVTERLPEEYADVLLTDGQEVCQAWFDDEDGWNTWHTSEGWQGARAWMPLPPPPREMDH